MGRFIVVIGLVVTGVGCLVMMGLPLGRLPGDLIFKRENSTIYIPLGTSILLSGILTFVSMLLRR